ncbi:hypothetical protein FGG78_15970 [Thioclava sp. BHET1]|nr:hypothetical protein FGG78_15970 [Thioclava sp. BHET1]
MTTQFQRIEYNTEALGGTFERLSQFTLPQAYLMKPPRTIFADADRLSRSIVEQLKSYGDSFAEKLATKATNRMLTPGRWETPGIAELICEVVTDKCLRKGSLSDAARQQRAEMIAKNVTEYGEVEFAILLLPFRTKSHLKNLGTLPDVGEFFTLARLHAIGAACRQAQLIVSKRVDAIVYAVGPSVRDAAEIGPCEVAVLRKCYDNAMGACEELDISVKSRAVLRKRLRQMAAAGPSVHVKNPDVFELLLVELARSAFSLSAWMAFKDSVHVPVRILACQDAGRYPCFSDVDAEQISSYRDALLDAVGALDLDPDLFRLVDYSNIKKIATQHRGAQASRNFFEARTSEFLKMIDEALEELYEADGKERFFEKLGDVGADGVLSPLFEPILFSLEHREIDAVAPSLNLVPQVLHFNALRHIYAPSKNKSEEILRHDLIASALRGAALYCAAYEANTGSKNPSGFDDVATMFPAALRMSIHQKDEELGHFSVHVSPTGNRTPWHGTACYSLARQATEVQMSIDLAGLVLPMGGVQIVPRGGNAGLFSRHARAGQPIAILMTPPRQLTEATLHDLFETKRLLING